MFTEREWLVMFPREPAPFAGPSLVDRPADPAKALRESDPLTRRNFLAALAPWPLVRNLVRVQLALTPYVSRVALRFGPSALFTGTVLAGTVVLNAGTFRAFHTAQLAVGIASVSLFFLTTLVIALYSRGFQSLITLPTFRGTRGTSGTSGSASAEYGWHPFATMARYQQLLSDGSKGPVDSDPEAKESSLINESGASLLFQHDSDDSHCPCSDCTRALTDRAGPFQLLEISLRVLTLDVLVMFAVWTPFVSFGAEYWRIWWCALFGAFFVLNVLDLNTLNALVRFTDNVAVILLKQRVRRRAVVLALRDFYRRLRASLDGEESELADPASEPHVVLHAFLADAWQRGFVTFSSGGLSTIVIYCVAPTVGAMANLIAGNCIPVWIPLAWLRYLLLLAIDLVNHSVANNELDVVRSMYVDARASLRLAIPRAKGDLRSLMEDHDRILASLERNERYRARFLGFAVDFAVARTVALTLFTVGIGLWSVLRSSGVYLTVEMACSSDR